MEERPPDGGQQRIRVGAANLVPSLTPIYSDVLDRPTAAGNTLRLPRVSVLVPAFAIFVLSFTTIELIERLYDRYHVLDQTNTLFDADPNKVLVNFSTSWGNDTYFRHPWLDLVFSVPVRASAKVLCGVFRCDAAPTRRNLGLLVTPLFGGLKNALLYLIFTCLGLTAARAWVLCALNLFAFSNLTIGSIPESFPVSSMMVVLFIALMISSIERGREWRMRHWIIAGAFATGITVANLIPLVICFYVSQRYGRQRGIDRGLRDTATVAAATLILTFSIAATGAVLASGSMTSLFPSATRGDFGETSLELYAPEQIAIGLANTFVPVTEPQIVPNRFTKNELAPALRPVLDFRLTYANSHLDRLGSFVWTTTVLTLIAFGAYRASTGSATWKAVVYASILLLVFNVGVNFVFYLHDMYLYSLGWEVPLLFMLAGLMRQSGRSHYSGVVVVLAFGSALASSHVLSWFIAAARAHL